MDFGFTKDQELFRESYRRFLEKENPTTLVRDIEEKETDYSRDIYGKMAELGWFQLRLPERYGGMGGSWVDMAILYEEMGRALLQGPHFTTVALCAEAILRLLTDPRLASRCAKNAARAAAQYDVRVVIPRIVSIYHEMVRGEP